MVRKVYVEVTAKFDTEGNITPLSVFSLFEYQKSPKPRAFLTVHLFYNNNMVTRNQVQKFLHQYDTYFYSKS